MLLSKDEIKTKAKLWLRANKDWLKEQKGKNCILGKLLLFSKILIKKKILEREEVKKKEREESKTFEPKAKKPVRNFSLK